MQREVRNWIKKIIIENSDIISIAVRQRAKFEGWLKFELANYAIKKRGIKVEVEYPITGRSRCDLVVTRNRTKYYIELKTPNSSNRIDGIADKRKPTTYNVNSIVADAQKLKRISPRGIMAFVLFPIPAGSEDWKRYYIDRINDKLNKRISEKRNCTTIPKRIGRDVCCDIVICTFSV